MPNWMTLLFAQWTVALCNKNTHESNLIPTLKWSTNKQKSASQVQAYENNIQDIYVNIHYFGDVWTGIDRRINSVFSHIKSWSTDKVEQIYFILFMEQIKYIYLINYPWLGESDHIAD